MIRALNLITILIAVTALPPAVMAGGNVDNPRSDRVVVTTSPTGSSLADALESVTVIGRAEIEAMPAATLADLLASAAGVDIRRRGASGVQADIGIRGTAYEQTLLLLNGIPLKDPQTGHHDLNVPVALEHIERIEVVRGPGGIAWGGNATGGVINIITRRPDGAELGVGTRAGSFSTRGGHVHAGSGDQERGHLLSASMEVSGGHLPDSRTDSDLRRAMYTGHARLEPVELTWGVGGEDKDFGAWKFYTADFPDQREETASRLAYLAGSSRLAAWDVDTHVFWRGHDDWFRTRVGELDFINEHETDVRGIQLDSRRDFGRSVLAAGLGLRRERIESSALDDHRRTESSVWAAYRRSMGQRGSVEAGVNLVRFSEYGNESLPSIAFGHRLTDRWHAHLSSARTARVPSWTEQFLVAGGNVGSPELEPERSTLHETGLRYTGTEHRLAAALFERRTQRLIDWAREPGQVTWRADNFDGHRSRGGEIEWRWRPTQRPRIDHLGASWTVITTRLDDSGRELKYALDYPRHAWTFSGQFRLPAETSLSFNMRRVRREAWNRGTLLAARLAHQLGSVQVYVEGTNLLDEEVIEAGFDTVPGRGVFAGLNWSMRP
jgi:vitamin B12 transporter